MTSTRNGFLCWSKAWVQVAEGILSAGIAQLKLANSMYPAEESDFALTALDKPFETTAQTAARVQGRFYSTIRAYRQINDDLAYRLFDAASTLAGHDDAIAASNQPVATPAETAHPVDAASIPVSASEAITTAHKQPVATPADNAHVSDVASTASALANTTMMDNPPATIPDERARKKAASRQAGPLNAPPAHPSRHRGGRGGGRRP